MKKIHLLAIMLVASFSAATSQTIADEADKAYMADDFDKAVELYNKSIQEEGTSSEALYNLGNAYYKNGNNGQAIIAYERALKLDPTNVDARTNLNFVNSRIVDKPSDNASLSEKLGEKIYRSMTPDGWAWTTFGCFVVFMMLVAGYIFTSSVPVRKTCFFGSLALLTLVIAGIIVSVYAARNTTNHSEAVVLSEAVHLGTSPRPPKDKSEEAFLLHEGTKVEIVDSLSVGSEKWYEVKVDGNNRAWISSADIEKI